MSKVITAFWQIGSLMLLFAFLEYTVRIQTNDPQLINRLRFGSIAIIIGFVLTTIGVDNGDNLLIIHIGSSLFIVGSLTLVFVSMKYFWDALKKRRVN